MRVESDEEDEVEDDVDDVVRFGFLPLVCVEGSKVEKSLVCRTLPLAPLPPPPLPVVVVVPVVLRDCVKTGGGRVL